MYLVVEYIESLLVCHNVHLCTVSTLSVLYLLAGLARRTSHVARRTSHVARRLAFLQLYNIHYYIFSLSSTMVKITADLVARAPVVFNPLGDRELQLRGLKIPNIRNLGVTMDQFDSIDLSSNEVQTLGNFPKQQRLQTLQLNDNSVARIEGAETAQALPNLKRLILTRNRIATFEDIDEIAHLKSLEFLSLEENPVTLLNGYRAYVVARMPQLRVLDYAKITQAERASAATQEPRERSKVDANNGSGMIAQGGNGSGSGSDTGLSKLSGEQIAALKEAASKAKTKAELMVLMNALETGVLPDGF